MEAKVYLLFATLQYLQKVGDELFPEKDGKILTTDIDYVDVWKVMLTANTNNNKTMSK